MRSRLAQMIIVALILEIGFFFCMYIKSIFVHLPKKEPEFAHVVVWTTHPLRYEICGDGDIMTSANVHRAFANANYFYTNEDYNSRLFYILSHTPRIHIIKNGSMKRTGPTQVWHAWRLHLKPSGQEGSATSMEYCSSKERALEASEELKRAGITTVSMDEVDVRRFPFSVYCEECKKHHNFEHDVEPKSPRQGDSSSLLR